MADKDELLEHDYDGIREYDNDLPLWWVNIFWITTIFGIGYAIYVHTGMAETDHDRLARQLAELKAVTEQTQQQESSQVTEKSLLSLTQDAAVVKVGQEVYDAKCAVCHGAEGQGLIGPNLTDEYWIHGGGTLIGIRHIVLEGVVEKGMLAWKGQLKPKEIDAVTAYIWTLQGSKPPSPKAPEGEKVTSPDSTTT